MREEYRADLRKARDVLRDLLERMEQLEVQIARQRRKVAALAVLGEQSGKGDDVTTELRLDGLTSACRSALRAAGRRGLTPIELRASLRQDRKSTRLNSSHVAISYAVFCLKKKSKVRDRKILPP